MQVGSEGFFQQVGSLIKLVTEYKLQNSKCSKAKALLKRGRSKALLKKETPRQFFSYKYRKLF